ncbi:MAG TPA: DUF4157 domain-containing protein [Pyrinomonadaceae bacterium]|nr:DUF4157 domain-containing protein [Pyrinomonadaceae bacterium]
MSFQLFTQSAAPAAAGESLTGAAGAADAGPRPSATEVNVAPAMGVIVEDGSPLGPGQVHRTYFLDTISVEIERVVDDELRPSGQSSRDCPYLAHWLRFYRDRPAEHIERVIQRYANPARMDLESVRAAIATRVRGAVQAWVRSRGRDVQIPEGITPSGTDDGAPAPSQTSGVPLQRKAVEGAPEAGPRTSSVGEAAAIRSHLQNGHPLEGSVRQRMERSFGQSFADVRVHTDGGAGQLAATHSARAFTLGTDVAFGANQYRPGTLPGDLVIAHELAHVVQQRGAVVSPSSPLLRGDDSAALEADANTSAARAVLPQSVLESPQFEDYASAHPARLHSIDTGAVTPILTSGLSLQRCETENLRFSGGNEVFAVAPTTTEETFQEGNLPGVMPTSTLGAGGTQEFTFDGDGDQMRELRASIRTVTSWPNGSARQINVDVTMLNSSETRSATYELADVRSGNGPLFVIFDRPTDGRRPARISLVSPLGTQNLLFYPPERTPQAITYRAELASQQFNSNQPPTISQSQTFSFPASVQPQLRAVFHADPPIVMGAIHAVDISVGAYNDRFRLTFTKPDPSQNGVIFGISVLSEGAPVSGERNNIRVPGLLSLNVLQSDAVRLAIDLNGDGQADLELFDELTGVTGYDYVSPLRFRTHRILAEGSGLPAETNFYYPIRNGLIVAGSTTPSGADFAAASNAQAVTGLAQQQTTGVPGLTASDQLGTISGELDAVEAMLNQARARAAEANVISQELFNAWDVVTRDFIMVQAQLSAPGATIPAALREQTAIHALVFYVQLAAAVISEDTGGGGVRGYHLRNRFTGLDRYVDEQRTPGQILAEQIQAGQWPVAIASFHLLVRGLDRWIAQRSQERFGAPDPDQPETNRANEMLYLTHLRQELAGFRSRNPVRVAAVFHPQAAYASSGRVSEVPLSLYYVQENGSWYLHDFSNPQEPWHTSGYPMRGPTEAAPPHAAFLELNEDNHFPIGTVHYQLRNGIGGEVSTTGPGAGRQVLTYVGVGAAAIGLGLVSFGTGTVAVIGTYALAVSALAGGTMAAVDLYERFTHGTATAGSVALDIAQIVAAFTGIGALGSGRILSVARVAAADSAPLTGARWALMATWAQRVVVPLAATNVAADVVTLAVMSVEGAQQYDAIDNAPGTPESRRRAKILLLGQLAVTGGLTALSLRGNVVEITRGRSIEIISAGYEPVVIPVGQSTTGARVTRSRPSGTTDDAAFRTAEQQHLENIRTNVTGEGGQALAQIEGLALSNQVGRSSGTMALDAAGNLISAGQPSSSMQELVQQVARANNASRAHGMGTEYVLDVRPGTIAGTTEVRIVGRARTGGGGAVSTAHLYVDVPARAQNENAQLQRLLAAEQTLPAGDPFKGSRFEIRPNGEIGINGQLDIHPNRLAQIATADLPGLLQATRELDTVGGDYSRVSTANRTVLDGFVRSGSYRLRFGFPRERARTWLAGVLQQLGLDINTVEVNGRRLFANMSPADLDRLYEAMGSGIVTAAPNLQRRGVAYALGRGPDSLRNFVEHYEFFVADFKERANTLIAAYRTRVAQAEATWRTTNTGRNPSPTEQNSFRNEAKDAMGIPRTRNAEDFYYDQLETQMANPANLNRPSAAAQEDVFARYEQMRTQLNGRFGVGNIAAGLSSENAIAAIKNLPEITFSTESAAVYHIRKHFRGLPATEQTRAANGVSSFLDAASQTIRDAPAGSVTSSSSQDGTFRAFVFTRTVGRTTMRAIVHVTTEGRVMLATFQ